MKTLMMIICWTIVAFQLGANDIILVGDSTMCNYDANKTAQTGWGMCLQKYTIPNVKIINRALGGSSIKSFAPVRWPKTMKLVKNGDFVIIGMAINDQGSPNNPKFSTIDEFKSGLMKWIADVKAQRGQPMLVTSTVQWRINGLKDNNGRLRQYNDAILDVARETGTSVVDLNDAMYNKLKSMPLTDANNLYMGAITHPKKGNINDFTHFRKEGAEFIASLFVDLCKTGKLPIAALFK